MNSMVVKGDAHYSKFKFARQTNFKPGMINTLGIFENEAIFKRILSQIDIVSKMYAGTPLSLTFEEEKKVELTVDDDRDPVKKKIVEEKVEDTGPKPK